MPNSSHIISLALLFCVVNLISPLAIGRQVDKNQLSIFEIAHPPCQSKTIIETGRDSLMTIANDLPGRNEYNELVRTFRKEQWGKLDASIELFQNVFEDSPLREAVAFLRVESLFDRVTNSNSPQVKEAEKALREVLLLYPKSKLVPNIQATAGAFWLRNGFYPKSLAIFTKAKEDYPFHPFNCLFQFGVAETNFLLNETEQARRSFKLITQKCQNPRLVTGAKLRIIELDNNSFSKPYGQMLSQLYQQESNIINRFYPEALYNLGEYKYRTQDYSSARFFFSEYLQSKNKDPECAPYASKRVADIASKTKNSAADVIGLYLQTRDQFPKTDIGKYSYIQALLLDYAQNNQAEQERRTLVIDETMGAMTDSVLRHLAGMAKGLAVLDSGKKGSLEYLLKIAKANPGELKTPELSEFIASRIYKVLQKDSKQAKDLELKKESLKDEELFAPIEEVFGNWIKGTSYEKATRDLYSELVLGRFGELLEKEKWDLAFELIDNWKQSELWPGESIDPKVKREVGIRIAQKLMNTDEEASEELSDSLVNSEEGMAAFVGQDFYALFVAANLNKKNLNAVGTWLKKIKPNRKIARAEIKIPQEINDYMNLERARGHLELKQFRESEELSKTIMVKQFKDEALEIRLESLRGQKEYKQAVAVGMGLAPKMQNESEKKRVLSSLVSDLSASKLWNQSEKLLKEAKQMKLQGKELAPFLYMVGKSSAEQKNCAKVVTFYNQALNADAAHLFAQEARFRLGKCYQQQRKKEQAKKQWQEVVASQDPFWGPMAKNEINLMEGP